MLSDGNNWEQGPKVKTCTPSPKLRKSLRKHNIFLRRKVKERRELDNLTRRTLAKTYKKRKYKKVNGLYGSELPDWKDSSSTQWMRDIHPLREDCCQSSETEDEIKSLKFFRGQKKVTFWKLKNNFFNFLNFNSRCNKRITF